MCDNFDDFELENLWPKTHNDKTKKYSCKNVHKPKLNKTFFKILNHIIKKNILFKTY